MKDVVQKQPDGRNAQGTVMGKGLELPYFLEHATYCQSPHAYQPGSSPNHILLGFYRDIIVTYTGLFKSWATGK